MNKEFNDPYELETRYAMFLYRKNKKHKNREYNPSRCYSHIYNKENPFFTPTLQLNFISTFYILPCGCRREYMIKKEEPIKNYTVTAFCNNNHRGYLQAEATNKNTDLLNKLTL